MKCWKCGNEITAGASKCPSCGADQNRSIPKSDIGRAMRQLYDRYGKDAVLGKNEYLDQGLSDLLNASGSIPDNALKLRRWIRTAMEAGIGRLYLDRLIGSGKPDDDFDLQVKMLMTEDAGLSEKAAKEIAGYFDDMIGWRFDRAEQETPRQIIRPKQETYPESGPVEQTSVKEGKNRKQSEKSKKTSRRKPYTFEIIGLCSDAGLVFALLEAYGEVFSWIFRIGIVLAAAMSLFHDSSSEFGKRRPFLTYVFIALNAIIVLLKVYLWLNGNDILTILGVGFLQIVSLLVCSWESFL